VPQLESLVPHGIYDFQTFGYCMTRLQVGGRAAYLLLPSAKRLSGISLQGDVRLMRRSLTVGIRARTKAVPRSLVSNGFRMTQ
jgi:hypothetical protein